MPGTQPTQRFGVGVKRIEELSVSLPRTSEFQKDIPRSVNLVFMKLHGSVNWQGMDGSQCLVIGTGKTPQITREPLLKWYWKCFRDVLSRPNCYLAVVGYGFGDEHVNEVIAEAVRNFSLNVFVISPTKFGDLMDTIQSQPLGDEILPAITPYNNKLTDLYVDNSARVKERLKEIFSRMRLPGF